jgi:hypothetical protein
MLELFVSWVNGLPYDKEALALLRKENLGIEMREFDEQIDYVRDAGVKRSCHNPARGFNKCLHDIDFTDIFNEPRVIKSIETSDTDTISFHNFALDKYPGYKNSHMFMLRMLKISVFNLEVTQYHTNKRVLFESPPYCLEEFPSHHLLSEPDYIHTLLRFHRVGYLFDIAHNYVSAHNKNLRGTYKGTIDDYFSEIIEKIKRKTHAVHLNVPFTHNSWYTDGHMPLSNLNKANEYILELTKKVLSVNPVSVLALEMNTGLAPYEHAVFMARQADYVRKKLNL